MELTTPQIILLQYYYSFTTSSYAVAISLTIIKEFSGIVHFDYSLIEMESGPLKLLGCFNILGLQTLLSLSVATNQHVWLLCVVLSRLLVSFPSQYSIN